MMCSNVYLFRLIVIRIIFTRLTRHYIKESMTREMLYKRAGHAEISKILYIPKLFHYLRSSLFLGIG